MSHQIRRVTSTNQRRSSLTTRARCAVSDARYWWRLHGVSIGDHRNLIVVAASAAVLLLTAGAVIVGLTSLVPTASPVQAPAPVIAPSATTTVPAPPPPATRPPPPPAPKPTVTARPTTPPILRKDNTNERYEPLRPARGR